MRIALAHMLCLCIAGGCSEHINAHSPNRNPIAQTPRQNTPTGAPREARAAWDSLLAAMQRRDENAIKRLTTSEGIASLRKRAPADESAALERWASGWKDWDLRWQASTTPGEATALLGPKGKEHMLRFKETPDGWRLHEWLPGM